MSIKIISGIVAVTMSVCSGFSMDKNINEDTVELGNWTETFQTNLGLIEHTPKHVKLSGRQSPQTRMKAQAINDISLKALLQLVVSVTREDFIKALKKAGLL